MGQFAVLPRDEEACTGYNSMESCINPVFGPKATTTTAQLRTTTVMTSVNTNTVPAKNSVGAPTMLPPTSSIKLLPQPDAVAAGTNILATGVPNAVVTVTSGQKNQAPAVYVKNGAVVSVSPIVGSEAVGQQVTTSARSACLQPSVAQGSPNRRQLRRTQRLPRSPKSRSLPQYAKHPAPLPVSPDLKKVPPVPELKIQKPRRHEGIVLAWNMPITNEYAAIASYELYVYQESSSPPSTARWKKFGDVKALPLPMACTLTQFFEGHKYRFAVRAVDIHSRVGPFSLPHSIVLTWK